MMAKSVNSQLLSESEFRKVFESLPGSFLLLSPQFIILAVSDDYERINTVGKDEITGQNIFNISPYFSNNPNSNGVGHLQSSFQFITKHLTAHIMPVQRYDIKRPDGRFEEKYWSVINKPILDNNGQLIYIIHRIEDITVFYKSQKTHVFPVENNDYIKTEREIFNRSEEIRIQNQELGQMMSENTAKLESVRKTIADYKFALDASSIVAITDQKGIIKEVNDNFCQISKYSREELIGQDHRIINSGFHTAEFIRNLWVTIAHGKIWKGELRNKAKDGTIYWVDTTIIPFVDRQGKPYQYLAIRSDITSRKLSEERIFQLNNELEDKVTERTLELTQSLERERELNNMKSRFVSLASHEFRTPLSAILSSTSLIKSYNKPEQEEKRKKHIERIKSSVKNLTDILTDFLSLDKLEQGKIEINASLINIREFTDELIDEVHGILKQGQNLIYHHRGELLFSSDKKILRSLFLNLISNAIKYSPEYAEIFIDTRIDEHALLLKVVDHGIGIPLKDQKHLFSLFFRAENAGAIPGTGLGLNIVKKYIELLGGHIGFDSLPGKGTTFNIEIPDRNYNA